ncbi:hypothetical protein [Telmatospirillum sp. J64-1]|uniref:hypothetical protein n=1 Tax=Telmatospirillum sp. J64-1 TaxID=2502183 RepID=UPI00115E213C|nr:hypothetical protein [Telmatospirillum sp. J64-1]
MLLGDHEGPIAAAAALILAVLGFVPGTPSKDALAPVAEAHAMALEQERSGTPLLWQDQRSGTIVTVTPARVFINDAGQLCRDYSLFSAASDATESRTACRQEDGLWRALNDPSHLTSIEPDGLFGLWLAGLSDSYLPPAPLQEAAAH